MDSDYSAALVSSTKSPFEQFLLGAPADTVDKFFSRWPIDLIFRLRQLNSSIFLAVEAYVGRVWKVKRIASRWFLNSDSFFTVLDKCDGVVSGSVALQFLSGDDFEPGDLDIYVPPHGILRMGRWLKTQGYKYHHSERQHPLFDVAALSYSSRLIFNNEASQPHSFTIFDFYRPPRRYPGNRITFASRVQVIVTRDHPVHFLVCRFHSSKSKNLVASSLRAEMCYSWSNELLYWDVHCLSVP